MPGSLDTRSHHHRPPLNADALLQAIQNEVIWRQGRNRAGVEDGAVRKIIDESNNREVDDPNLAAPIDLPRWRPFVAIEFKESYSLADFLAHYDSAFLDAAYRGILLRDPDDAGRRHYLDMLREKGASRVWVLGVLRFSNEGRTKGVPVRGLRRAMVRHYWSRIPVLGAFTEWALKLITLRSTCQGLGDSITQLERANQQMGDFLNRHAAATEMNLRRQRTALLDQPQMHNKADRSALDALKSSFDLFKKEFHSHQGSLAGSRMSSEFYLKLEDRFRGSRETIYERLKAHLPSVERAISLAGAGKLADLGCGRGEWLELLRDNDIEAYGIDINSSMVNACRNLGLKVEHGDALAHFRDLPDDSLVGVSGIHIVEHLPFGSVIKLFEECLRVLKPGGVIIFETPNPENLVVGACSFYLDPSHQHPIPPLLLEHLAAVSGFGDVQIHRLGHEEVEAGTPEIDTVVEDSQTLSWLYLMTKQTLAVAADYAVVGHKHAESTH